MEIPFSVIDQSCYCQLMSAAENMFADPILMESSVNAAGPIIFLLKVLVRRFGIHTLKKATDSYPWLIPSVLQPDIHSEVIRSEFIMF